MTHARYPPYTSHSSSSAPPSSSTYARRALTRTPSPPASAYFARELGDLDPSASASGAGVGGGLGLGGGGGLGLGGGEREREPQPLNTDAREHFAYSTTLRRHHPDSHIGMGITPGMGLASFDGLRDAASEEGLRGVWARVVRGVRGLVQGGEGEERGAYAVLPREERDREERREEGQARRKETPSAVFAGRSVEVCPSFFLCFCFCFFVRFAGFFFVMCYAVGGLGRLYPLISRALCIVSVSLTWDYAHTRSFGINQNSISYMGLHGLCDHKLFVRSTEVRLSSYIKHKTSFSAASCRGRMLAPLRGMTVSSRFRVRGCPRSYGRNVRGCPRSSVSGCSKVSKSRSPVCR